MSFLGAMLPAWGYHLTSGFIEAGNYFLSVAVGVLVAAGTAGTLVRRKGPKFVFVIANAIGCAAFLFLAFVSSPALAPWRILGLLGIGTGTGLLSAATFDVIAPVYPRGVA